MRQIQDWLDASRDRQEQQQRAARIMDQLAHGCGYHMTLEALADWCIEQAVADEDDDLFEVGRLLEGVVALLWRDEERRANCLLTQVFLASHI